MIICAAGDEPGYVLDVREGDVPERAHQIPASGWLLRSIERHLGGGVGDLSGHLSLVTAVVPTLGT